MFFNFNRYTHMVYVDISLHPFIKSYLFKKLNQFFVKEIPFYDFS